jgi:hypothetical protein
MEGVGKEHRLDVWNWASAVDYNRWIEPKNYTEHKLKTTQNTR